MPEPLRPFTSRLIPLLADNLDTDQIIPARYLKGTSKDGLGEGLFADWRYDGDGNPREGFVLNRPEMAGRSVLLAGANFGSAREHAAWALRAFGVKAVLAPLFADIFRNNALKNGLLPVELPADAHAELAAAVEADPDAEVTVDLAAEAVTLPGGRAVAFRVDPFARQMLLDGTDELGYLLSHGAAVAAYEDANPARVDTTAPAWGG